MFKHKAIGEIFKNYYGVILLLLICILFSVALLVQNNIDNHNQIKHIQEWEIDAKVDNMLDKWVNSFPQSIIGSKNLIMSDNPAVPMIQDVKNRIQDKIKMTTKIVKNLGSSSSDYKFYTTQNLFANSQTTIIEDKFVLYENGVVFGPADEISKGEYIVTFLGNGYNHCTFDAFANSNWYAVQYQERYRDDTKVVLFLYIIEDVDDIEYRVFNTAVEETADLYRIIVEKTGNL